MFKIQFIFIFNLFLQNILLSYNNPLKNYNHINQVVHMKRIGQKVDFYKNDNILIISTSFFEETIEPFC